LLLVLVLILILALWGKLPSRWRAPHQTPTGKALGTVSLYLDPPFHNGFFASGTDLNGRGSMALHE
jgi:hypothetical protein